MQDFVTQDQRDAYATIRGFVYQVDRTIMAWLDVDEATVLYCEAGEDVDYVTRVFDEETREYIEERLIEQIKHRENKSLTLNSPEAIEALGNFLVLKKANPEHRLKFRFFTNTFPGKERGSDFPRNLPGIEAWKCIQQKEFQATEVEKTLRGIRGLIEGRAANESSTDADAEKTRTPAFEISRWLSSKQDSEVIEELIDPFDWAFGSEGTEDIQGLITAKMQESSYASSVPEAEELYQRLFMHVFRTISKKGEKRLDHSTLMAMIKEGTLVEADRKLLEGIRQYLQKSEELLQTIAKGVDKVQRSQTENNQQIAQLVEEIQDRFLHVDNIPNFILAALQSARPDSLPIQPTNYVSRGDALSSIDQYLGKHTLVWLTATTGMGKTLLASSIYSAHENSNKLWVTLRGIEEGKVDHLAVQLCYWHTILTDDAALSKKYLLGEIPLSELTHAVVEVAGNEALVIIDDLPNIIDDEQLIGSIGSLMTALQTNGGKLITTSQYSIPQNLHSMVGTDAVEYSVLPMDSREIMSILQIAGAPVELLTVETCGLILAITNGHPILVSATTRWLENNGWAMDFDRLAMFASGEPISEALDEARRKVRYFVDDGATRELLDRLSIIRMPFLVDAMWAVANAEPAIDRPRDRFDDLAGPWVQPLEGDLFEVSPLLQNSWQDYLSPDLKQRLHVIVARHHLKQTSITPMEGFQVWWHLVRAHKWLDAAIFISKLLNASKTTEEARQLEWALLSFPISASWPQEVPLVIRITIRALQIRVQILLKLPIQQYEQNLEELTAQATGEEILAVAGAHGLISVLVEGAPPGVTAKHSLKAARAYHQVEDILPHFEFPIEQSIWGAVPRIKSHEEMDEVLAVMRDLTDEERQIVFDPDMGQEMSVLFVDMSYGIEAVKDSSSQDWNAVISFLDKFIEYGQLEGAEPILAASIRAKSIIISDYLGKPADALSILDSASDEMGDASRFLLACTKASILLTNGSLEESIFLYRIALTETAKSQYPFVYSDALKRGMVAATRSGDWEEAKNWCIDGIHLKRSQEGAGITDYLEFLGELSWILWSLDQRSKACGAMYGLISRLISKGDVEDPRYEEMWRKAGYLLSWMLNLLEIVNLPKGEQEETLYKEPSTGFFSIATTLILNPEEDPQAEPPDVYMQVGLLSAELGLLRLARVAFHSSSKLARDAGFLLDAGVRELQQASIEATLGNADISLELSISGMKVFPFMPSGAARPSNDVNNVEELWDGLKAEQRESVERVNVFTAFLLPAIATVLSSGLNREDAIVELTTIQAAFESKKEELLAYDLWETLLGYFEMALKPETRRQDIIEIIKALDNDQFYERIMIYMALANRDDVPPQELATLQAVTLSSFARLKSFDSGPIRSISHWIISRWRNEVADRGFRINHPNLLRSTLNQTPESSRESADAARVLLSAEAATGVRFTQGIRAGLKHALGED